MMEDRHSALVESLNNKLGMYMQFVQSTHVVSTSKELKYYEISVPRHIRFAGL